MVKSLASFPSQLFYASRLIDTPSTRLTEQPVAQKFETFITKHYLAKGNGIKRYLNVQGSQSGTLGTSKYNLDTVAAGMQTLDLLMQERFGPDLIAIATPYQAQYKVYKAAFRQFQSITPDTQMDKIRICKIDGYQGGKCMLIILNLVITNKPGFVKDTNCLNIVLTRARDELIIISDIKAIERAHDSGKRKHSSSGQQPLLIQLSDNYKRGRQVYEILSSETNNSRTTSLYFNIDTKKNDNYPFKNNV